MQARPFLIVALFALLSGCSNKEEGTASSTYMATETLKSTEAQASIQMNGQPVAPAADPATLAIGQKVFKGTCSICHKSGLNGAPRMGNKKDWEPRIAQGKEVLYDHSINGYRGKRGSMPSRGSNPRLSEAEVKAAVDYIVEHAIPSWSIE